MTVGFTLLAVPSSAVAQDWGVKRDPFDRRIINRYKSILKRNPADRDALRKLTRMYRKYRTLRLLVDEYNKQLAKKPKDFSTLVVLGHLALAQKDKDKALAFYQRAAVVKPKGAAVQAALGDLYRESGKLEQAKSAYKIAVDNSSNKKLKIKLLRRLADLALDGGKIDEAKEFYARYIALDPKNVQARIDLGDALLRYKKFDEAIAEFGVAEKKLSRDPTLRVTVVARIGQAHERAGRPHKAIDEYKRAIGMVSRTYYLRRELTERIINIHRDRGELAQLIAELDKEWKRRDHFEWNIMGRLYEETGQQEKAIGAFKKAVAKAPYELETQRKLIRLLENAGRTDDALAQYERAIRVAPGEPQFQLELAARYWRANKTAKALGMLKKLSSRFPGDAGVHTALADLYSAWGKPKLALAAYERLTRIEPGEPTHLINLGEQYWAKDDKKKARSIWKQIIRRKTPENYARLGEVYAQHLMPKEALEMYDKAIKLKPKSSKFFRGRAAVHEGMRKFRLAVADLKTSLSLIPDRAANKPARRDTRRKIVNLLRQARGSLLRNEMRAWQAAFTNASKPDLSAGYFLVEAHIRLGQYKAARGVLERVLVLAPDDLFAMTQLVDVYRSQKQYDKAIALLEKLVTLAPARSRDFYTKISEIKTILHQDDQAILYARKALEKSPKDPEAWFQLAQRYEEMHRFDDAIAAYKKTIEYDEKRQRAYFALARIYKNSERPKDAALLYRKLLGVATDPQVLHRAGRAAIDLEELTQTLGELERELSPLATRLSHKPVYRRILVELLDRHVLALVRAHRRAPNPKERKSIEKELSRLGALGLSPLLDALADEQDVNQQRIAVSVLGFLGNPGAAPALVRLAKREPDKQGGKRAIGTLFAKLDWDVRVEALVAAGRLGDPRTLPDLFELANHREVAMREAAVFALGTTRDKRALAALTASLADRRPSVRTLACLGLAQLANKKSLPAITGVIRDRDQSDWTRAACAFAAGVIADPSSVDPLATTLDGGNGEAQRVAAWALGRIADKRAMPALLTAYFSKRDRVREAVAWALPRVAAGKSDRSDVARFIDYPLQNGKFDEGAAIRSLLRARGESGLVASLLTSHRSALSAALKEALARHRDLVVRALEDLNADDDGLAVGPLTAGLDSASTRERTAARKALASIGTELLPSLRELHKHPDSKVQSLSLLVSAKIGGAGTVAPILAGLSSERSSVRAAAMQAAATYSRLFGADQRLLAAVSARLSAKRWEDRVAAARALGEFGRKTDVSGLRKALRGDDKSLVREAAAMSLGAIGDPSAAADLEAAAGETEPVPRVRTAAKAALGKLRR